MGSAPSGRAAHTLRLDRVEFGSTRNLDFYLAAFFN